MTQYRLPFCQQSLVIDCVTPRCPYAVVAIFPSFSFQKVKYYTKIALDYQAAIDNVLWNNDEGTWLDYNMRDKRSRNMFYPSNLTPLYTMSYNQKKKREYAKRSISYLKRNKIDLYFGELSSVFVSIMKHFSFRFLTQSPKHTPVLFTTRHNCRLNFLIRFNIFLQFGLKV